MPSADNQEKALHGVGVKKALSSTIESLEARKAIISRIKQPKYGYSGMYQRQFKADEELTLADNTKLIVFSTNSIRSDRVKEQQWDASNIKAIDTTIDSAWLVVPDDEALKPGKSLLNHIRGNHYFTAIDDIVTIQTFYERVFAKLTEIMSLGAVHDAAGNAFEEVFVAILKNQDNLKRYNGDNLYIGYRYGIFELTMKAIGIAPQEVTSIEATRDIPRLPNGGMPKTDVAATFYFASGDARIVTFSLKKSSSSMVSVHEYTADAFAEILDPENEELRRLLNAFQAAGSAKDMNNDDRIALAKALEPLRMKLDLWVLGGIGAPHTSRLQTADYLVLQDKENGNVALRSVVEYCSSMEAENNGKRAFGTIFGWTYPSKKRTKAIQLKGKISM